MQRDSWPPDATDCHELVPHVPTLECVSGAAVACLAVFLAAWVLCSLILLAAVAFEDRYN